MHHTHHFPDKWAGYNGAKLIYQSRIQVLLLKGDFNLSVETSVNKELALVIFQL